MSLDLHELAALPAYGDAAAVIRKKHDPLWGLLDGDGVLWKVEVAFSYRERDCRSYEVVAESEDAAIAAARRLFDAESPRLGYDDPSIDDIDVRPCDDQSRKVSVQ